MYAARWDTYQPRHVMTAWISAGVAARQLSRPSGGLGAEIRQMDQEARTHLHNQTLPDPFPPQKRDCEMGHQQRLAFARVWGREGNSEYIQRAAEVLEGLRDEYPHILEIEEELSLQYIELKQYDHARAIHGQVQQRYQLISEEMLCRFGKMSKSIGQAMEAAGDASGARAYYKEALEWYSRAFEIRRNYYPGINVASLTFVLSSRVPQDVVEEVVASCGQQSPGTDEGWILAVHGEVGLLTGHHEEAAKVYQAACRQLPLRDRRSARHQAEWIIRHAGAQAEQFWTQERLEQVFAC